MSLTKSESEELYDKVRKAIRKTIIATDDTATVWKHLRVFDFDPERTPEANASRFMNSDGLSTWLAEVQKAGGNIDDIDLSTGYASAMSLIRMYFYFKQAVVLYTDHSVDYQYDPEVLEILTDLIQINMKTKQYPKEDYRDIMDYLYILDDEILRLREPQEDMRFVNCPFMLVCKDSIEEEGIDLLTVYTLQFLQNRVVSYLGMTIKNGVITNLFGTEHKMKNIMFEEVGLTNFDTEYHPILLTGGYFTFTYVYDENQSHGNVIANNYVDSVFSVTEKYKEIHDEDKKIEFSSVLASTTMIFMNQIYMAHAGFKAYIRRTPEIKIMLEKIKTMTHASRMQLERDHPSIQALNYTKYDYIHEDNTGHKGKGGTHASPCEHRRSSTMRFNPKTGQRDIPVRESIVNRGKMKTQYYDNKKDE